MKSIYFISFVLKSISRKILEKITNWSCKNYVISGKNTKFMISSKVINTRRKKEYIKIGNNTIIRGELFVFKHGGKIIIGNYCYIGELSRIWSADSISIGNRVLISHNVNIHDNNGHPIDEKLRHEHYKQIINSGHPEKNLYLNEKPIVIEDDVWIGFNSTILKGVLIGKGAIVGACSVVTKDVPPFTVVAGNPAVIIKHLNEKK